MLYKEKEGEKERERENTAGCITVRPELTRSEQESVTGEETAVSQLLGSAQTENTWTDSERIVMNQPALRLILSTAILCQQNGLVSGNYQPFLS